MPWRLSTCAHGWPAKGGWGYVPQMGVCGMDRADAPGSKLSIWACVGRGPPAPPNPSRPADRPQPCARPHAGAVAPQAPPAPASRVRPPWAGPLANPGSRPVCATTPSAQAFMPQSTRPTPRGPSWPHTSREEGSQARPPWGRTGGPGSRPMPQRAKCHVHVHVYDKMLTWFLANVHASEHASDPPWPRTSREDRRHSCVGSDSSCGRREEEGGERREGRG